MTELFHAFLAFFLLLQELAFAAHIAPIALREHVLAQRLDGCARNDGAADRRGFSGRGEAGLEDGFDPIWLRQKSRPFSSDPRLILLRELDARSGDTANSLGKG